MTTYHVKLSFGMLMALIDIATNFAGASPADDGRTLAALRRRGLINSMPRRAGARPALTYKGHAYLQMAEYECAAAPTTRNQRRA